jgi:predicted  nucleic acid-binding Zn-ribbon protein
MPDQPELHDRVHALEEWRDDTEEVVRDLRARADAMDAVVSRLDASIERMEAQSDRIEIGLKKVATRDDMADLARQFNGVPVKWFMASVTLIAVASIVSTHIQR